MDKKIKKQAPNTTTSFFNCRYAPFSDTYPINEPFLIDTENVLIHRMTGLIAQGKSFALYGEPGVGKSMLLKAMAHELDAKTYKHALIPYGGLKKSVLLKEICEAFDLDTAGRINLLAKIRKRFKPDPDKAFPVIFIDEAQEIERDTLMALTSILHDPTSGKTAASLILSGHPKLRKILELDVMAAIRTRMAFIFALPNLNPEQSTNFIQHRLHIAEADPNIFDEEALECMAMDGTGNRRVLMNLAAMAMEEAARRKEKVVTADLINSLSLEVRA